MAYGAKKIYYRFGDHLSRLVLDYEASRQISPESEKPLPRPADRPVQRGPVRRAQRQARPAQCRRLGRGRGPYPHLGRARLQQGRR